MISSDLHEKVVNAIESLQQHKVQYADFEERAAALAKKETEILIRELNSRSAQKDAEALRATFTEWQQKIEQAKAELLQVQNDIGKSKAEHDKLVALVSKEKRRHETRT